MSFAAQRVNQLKDRPEVENESFTSHFQFVKYIEPLPYPSPRNLQEGVPTVTTIPHNPSFSNYSVWKPLTGPVGDWPLAICDNSTIDPENDVQPADQVYADRAVENCQVHYSDKQKWYYISDQRDDEAWVFLQADSAKGSRPGKSKY